MKQYDIRIQEMNTYFKKLNTNKIEIKHIKLIE